MLMGDLFEKEDKNKIRTENDILYSYHWGSNLLLKDRFSPLPTALCMRLWIFIVHLH